MNIVVNGNFETGDFTGWSVHHGVVAIVGDQLTGAQKRKINWNRTESDQPPPMIVDSAAVLSMQNAPIVPFEGVRMARINDLIGGNHATCMHQDVVLPPDFGGDCAFIGFNWGAMLGGSDHTDLKTRPRFEFVVNRWRAGSRWKTILREEFIAPESGGDGWTDIRTPGATEPVWYKSGAVKRSMAGSLPGDRLRVRFAAEDCPESGHGGAAFVDNVVITTGCDVAGPQASPITLDAPPHVFTPNADGMNDIWSISNLQGACHIELSVFDRWEDQVFYFRQYSFDGIWPNLLPVWNGMIRTKRKKRGLGKRKTYYSRMISDKDMDDHVVFYVLKLSNCHETRDETGFTHVYT